MSTPEPGYHGYRPASAATIAQILSGNGYCTAAVGKWHQTPPVEVSPSGPFPRWPIGEGFDYFYGFMGAEMNHWYPQLYQGRYADRAGPAARGRLPPLRGPGRPRDLLDREPAGDHARPAVLHLRRPRARRTRRSTSRRSGATSTPAGSTPAGTRSASRPWRGRRSSASCPSRPSSRRGPRGCRAGTSSTRPSSGSPPASWRPTPASPSTPTSRSAGSSTRSRTWASSTTRCSSTCSATTEPPARAARAAPSASTSSGTASRTTPPTWPPGSTRSATPRRTPSTRSAGRWR